MQNQKPLFIEDQEGNRLHYHFTPAALISNFVPLVVILDDALKDKVLHFEYKMWNVLTIVLEDPSQGQRDQNVIQNLIAEICEGYECEEHLYLYGRGKYGVCAIIQGIISDANALYTEKLEPSLSDKRLLEVLNDKHSYPIVYLSEEDEKTEGFDLLNQHDGIKVHLRSPEAFDDEVNQLKATLNFFERMISQPS